MPRRRPAESVPEVEDGIKEVLIEHRKTKRGIRTTAKVVPVLKPSKKKPGQSSRSKKGKQHQVDPEQMEGVGEAGTIEDTPGVGELVDDFPDFEPEGGQSQAMVSPRLHPAGEWNL